MQCESNKGCGCPKPGRVGLGGSGRVEGGGGRDRKREAEMPVGMFRGIVGSEKPFFFFRPGFLNQWRPIRFILSLCCKCTIRRGRFGEK